MKTKKITIPLCVSSVLPVVCTAWLIAPIGVVQGVYAKYFGLPLSTIAIVILCARLFDAISDPLVGFYSDRFYQRYGTRIPFIVIGGVLFVISSYFLYVPYQIDTYLNVSSGSLVNFPPVSAEYFLFWFFAFFLTWTLFEIPHMAWVGDLAPMPEDKAKVYSFRSAAQFVGMLIFYAVPMLPIFGTMNITPETLKISVIISGACMALFLVLFVRIFSEGKIYRLENLCVSNMHRSERGFMQGAVLKGSSSVWGDIVNNKPFLLFVSGYALASISIGMWYGLIFIYVDVYLQVGELFSPVFSFSLLFAVLLTPFWCYLSNLFSKKNTLIISMLIVIVGFYYTGMLSPLEVGLVELLFMQIILSGGFACLSAVSPALVSEIADFGQLKTGDKRSGSYFSVFTFIHKSGGAISSALGFSIAGWYGFDVASTSQGDSGSFGIKLAVAWIPVFFATASIVVISLLPITDRRHRIIRRRLGER